MQLVALSAQSICGKGNVKSEGGQQVKTAVHNLCHLPLLSQLDHRSSHDVWLWEDKTFSWYYMCMCLLKDTFVV